MHKKNIRIDSSNATQTLTVVYKSFDSHSEYTDAFHRSETWKEMKSMDKRNDPPELTTAKQNK